MEGAVDGGWAGGGTGPSRDSDLPESLPEKAVRRSVGVQPEADHLGHLRPVTCPG